MTLIQPVILSGGSGTRLWPLSRVLQPKQLQSLMSEYSLLQETALRVADRTRFAPPIVVSNEEHRFAIAAQLEEIGLAARAHLLEPAGRNTAAAVAVAAHFAAETDAKQVLLVLPSDHLITERDRFLQGVLQGAELASSGAIGLFGIPPAGPETGYGYIVHGPQFSGKAKALKVHSFVEKPEKRVAEELIAGRTAFWNSGIFLFRADTILSELMRLRPQIHDAAKEAVARAGRSGEALRLDSGAFLRLPSEPIDKAVMEHSDRLAVLPAEFGWSDVGTWGAIWDVARKDAHGNAVQGDAVLLDSSNCFVRTDRTLVAAVGLSDTVIVEDGDAVLVCARDKSQGVKDLVERLRAQGRREQLNHLREMRPWGISELVSEGPSFRVKTLVVNPGAALSLQMHRRRAEHWVIVKGTAEVLIDGAARILGPTQTVDIPLGAPHRLRNPGHEPLTVIEVQLGSYLGEDDIVRLEDAYGRPVGRG